MTREEFEQIGMALRNVSGSIAERQRQENQGATPPFQFLHDTLLREATRLHVHGAAKLAQGMLALRDELEATDNG